jgi:hypothetical protein
MNKIIKDKKGRKGPVSVSWANGSVSSLVVIAGIFSIFLGATLDKGSLIFLGVIFVLLGLFGAIFMTALIRGRI